MLRQVERNVRVESANDILGDVQLGDKGEEDLALDGLGRGGPGAVGAVCRVTAGVGVGAGIETGG